MSSDRIPTEAELVARLINDPAAIEALGEVGKLIRDPHHRAVIEAIRAQGDDFLFPITIDPPLPDGVVMTLETLSTKLVDDGPLTHREIEAYARRLTNKAKPSGVTDPDPKHFGAKIANELPMHYDPAGACFWLYHDDDGLFHRESNAAIAELAAKRLHREIDSECGALMARAGGDKKKQASAKSYRLKLTNFVTARLLGDIVNALKGIAERRNFFDTRPDALHVLNGALRVEDGGARFDPQFDPVFRARARSPYPYRDDAQCHRFLNELLRPMLNGEDIELFRKWLGLTLYGRNLAQKIMLLDGTPGRGKGVLLRIVTAMVGRRNATELRTEHLAERFELSRYVGKSLLTAADVAGDFLQTKSVGKLKSLTGGDPLDTESKNANEVGELDGDFNILIVSNTRLRCRLDGDVGAWRRRLMILRTDAPEVTKKIPDFEKLLLREEGPGILKWAVDGFLRAMDELRTHGAILMTDAQRRRVDDLLDESNALERFVTTAVVKDAAESLTVEELSEAVGDFCADRGWAIPSEMQIHRELPDLLLRHHSVTRSNSVQRMDGGRLRSKRGYRGVALA